jgi:peptidoglycan/LPS O-acetylase OafA/YrhL
MNLNFPLHSPGHRISASPDETQSVHSNPHHKAAILPEKSPLETSRNEGHLQYRPEIDGLRALALIPVILFHAGFQAFSGGFIGVDVFFVISGYLITSIILSEQQAGVFTLLNFYERRARRILPALFVVMFACLPFAWLWLLPASLKSFSHSVVAVSGFASNIWFWQESGYFTRAAELKPLLHTWSLAVEEQYYLLFPILLLLTWRLGKRWSISLLSLIAIISLAVAQWYPFDEQAFRFFMLPTRLWELLIGVFAAFYLSNQSATNYCQSGSQSISSIGLLLITCSVFAFDKNTPFPSLYTLTPTIGAALIILFATPQTLVGKLLGSRLFVGVGLISYSAYLWHQPLFVFARYRSFDEPSKVMLGGLAVAAIVLAYFSWKYVEIPFRKRQCLCRRQVFLYGAVGGLSFVVIGLIGHFSNGFANYYVNHRLTDHQRNIYQLIGQYTGGGIDMVDDGECIFWGRTVNAAFEARFRTCAKRYGKALVILGDSHALNIYNAFAKSNIKPFIVGIAHGGCRPHDNFPYCQYDSFNIFAEDNQGHIESLIFHQSGAYLIGEPDGTVYYDSHSKNDVSMFSLHEPNIRAVSHYLGKLSQYISVIWLGPFIEARVSFESMHRLNDGLKLNEKSFELFSKLDNELKLMLSSADLKFKYVSFSEVLGIDRDFLLVDECLTYRDADHFSVCGELILSRKIAEVFREAFTDGLRHDPGQRREEHARYLQSKTYH